MNKLQELMALLLAVETKGISTVYLGRAITLLGQITTEHTNKEEHTNELEHNE